MHRCVPMPAARRRMGSPCQSYSKLSKFSCCFATIGRSERPTSSGNFTPPKQARSLQNQRPRHRRALSARSGLRETEAQEGAPGPANEGAAELRPASDGSRRSSELALNAFRKKLDGAQAAVCDVRPASDVRPPKHKPKHKRRGAKR